jgi:hypothetical protein
LDRWLEEIEDATWFTELEQVNKSTKKSKPLKKPHWILICRRSYSYVPEDSGGITLKAASKKITPSFNPKNCKSSLLHVEYECPNLMLQEDPTNNDTTKGRKYCTMN